MLQYASCSGTQCISLLMLLLSLDYGIRLSYGYVPDLTPASKKFYEAVSTEDAFLEEVAVQPEKLTEQKMVVESSNDALSDKSSVANENNLRKKVGMLVRVTRRMINYCARELKLSFQKELENEQLPEFSRILMRLNVSVLSPRIHNVIIPRSTYKVLPNDTVEMRMRGGSVQLQGFYRAVYRTIREGELAANLSSFAINLKFKISTTFAGKLLLENVVCDAEVRVVDVQLVPKLHDLVDEGLRTAFDEHTSVVICETLESYIAKFEERLNKLIRSPLVAIRYKDIMEHLLIDTTISYGISLMEDYFDFPLVGTPTISKMNTTSLHPLVKLPEDKSKMVYIYITEFVLNSFLKKLDTFGNTALLLSAVPEFDGLLQLNCSENLECMGDFLQDAEPYQFDSGTMLLKMRSPAIATLRDGFMLLDLNLKVTVSYVQDGVDVNVLEFDWLLTVRINNAFLNEHLVSKDEAVRITNATLSLVELKMSGVTPYVEMVPNFTEHLQRLIVSRRKALEKLLTEQCSLITVIPDTAYEAVSRTGAFRNRTMLIATDMEWTPEHFSLFS